MEVIAKWSYTRYNPVNIYRDDIIDLYPLFSDNLKMTEFTIGDFKLTNIDEIDELGGQEFSSLRMAGHIPNEEGWTTSDCISLNIDGASSGIHVSNENCPELVGIKDIIERKLKKRSNRYSYLKSWKIFIPFQILLGFLYIFSIYRFADFYRSMPLLIVMIPLFVTFLFPIFLTSYNFKITQSSIIIANSHERPNFWVRNRDQIITDIIVGIIILIVGVVIGKML